MIAVSGDDELARRTGDPQAIREIFDALPVMVVAFDGPDYRITAINAAARAATGRTEVIGLPLREAFPELVTQQVLPMYDQVSATGKPVVQRGFRTQLELGHGERIQVYLDLLLVPTFGTDGAVTGVIASATDVTAAVRQLRAAEEEAWQARYRYEQAREVTEALQRELLPAGVPVLPGVQIAASYLLADAETAAGGDWFDALPLPDGRVALLVGDVVGHGVAASGVMGQLRVVLYERLAATADLLDAISAADRIARTIPAARAATVCAAILDPGTGELAYCTAGHPPPLLVTADGQSQYLPVSGSGPLGTGSAFTAAGGQVAPGDLLLLYTDGILERPGRDLYAATAELARVAADAAAGRALRDGDVPAGRVATQALELLTRLTGHSDDITLLAAQRVPAPPDLSIKVPADLGALGEIRHRLGKWLAAAGVSREEVTLLQHALGELIANAVEHAYPDGADTATVTLTATLTGSGELRAEVRDHGSWREPRAAPDRGLGLALAGDLVDTLDIQHGEHGTTAAVTHRLTRPARLLSGGAVHFRTATPVPGEPDPFLILEQPSAPRPRVRVDGPVDAQTAPLLHQQLQQATGAGTRSLTVDLAGVTHLASAGVAVLHRIARQNAAQETELCLYAPPGSPAQAIAALVSLRHVTADPDY